MRKTATYIFLVALGLCLASLLGYNRGLKASNTDVRIVRDTLLVRDTITLVRPVSVLTRVVDTAYFAVHDTIHHHDSVFLPLPVEQKVYEDSTYRAVVSGIRPSLDSISVFRNTRYITITKTTAPPLFSFGLALGTSLVLSPDGSVHGGLGATAGLVVHF